MRSYGGIKTARMANANTKSYNTGTYQKQLTAAAIETKNYDMSQDAGPFTGAAATIASTGTVCLNQSIANIAQGTSSSNREGREITVTGVEVRATFTQAGQNVKTAAPATVRLMLILDRQCNKNTTPVTAAMVVQNTSDSVLAFPNWSWRQRFTILDDRLIELNPTSYNSFATAPTGATNNVTKEQLMAIKCQIPMEFDNSTNNGATTSITSNNIFLLAFNYSTTTSVTIDAATRVLFVG